MTEARRRPTGLWILAAFTAIALVGYGLFSAHPGLVPLERPWMLRFYQYSFQVMAQGHIVISAAVLVAVLIRTAGARWLPGAAAVGGLAFLSEWVGTGYGVPFGPYSYTALLGARIGGRVPWSIPISWYLMALPAFLLAARTARGRRTGTRLLLGAALLTIWDLVLDPAMSYLTPYWTWGERGVYYGMPALNLVGWMVTGSALMAILEWTGAREWARSIPTSWLTGYYGLVAAMPLGMCALSGAWGAVALTGSAWVGWWVLSRPLGLRSAAAYPEPA